MELYCYRQCPVEGLSFSPYELLFGRSLIGPLSLLKDTWLSKPVNKLNKQHVFNYVMELRDKIDNIMQITEKETMVARQKSKEWFDKDGLVRELAVGKSVLLFFRIEGKPLNTTLHV